MKRNATGLFVAVLVLAGPARADDAPTIADVKKAWAARQDANASFRVEWVETVKYKAGALDDRARERNPGPHPPEDTEFKAVCSFAVDGDRVAIADERMIYNLGKKTWIPHAQSTSFEGKTWMTVYPLLSRGWGRVQIETGFARNMGAVQSATNAPRLVYRPLTGQPSFDFKRFKLAEGTTKIGEAECVEVVPTDAAKKDAAPGYSYSLRCDSDRDFLPIRERQRTAAGGYDVDYAYRQDDKGRWLLKGWTYTQRGQKDALQYTMKAEVKKLELGHTFAADAFAPKPPPGSFVTVYDDGAEKDAYLVRTDGTKRSVAADEQNKSYDELAKTNADGTPYVPAKK